MGPGRPKSAVKTQPLTIAATAKLLRYLDDIIVEEGLGHSRPEVARNLIWQGIQRLIRDRTIDRRRGGFGEEDAAAIDEAPSDPPERDQGEEP